MKKRIKKAFTLVELLVVIAILAVLSTVAVVGYTSFTNKAYESADITAVKQMNTALAAEIDKPDNIIEVVEILNDAGFNTEKGLTPVYKNHNFYWYRLSNEIVYINEANDSFELVYPEDISGFPSSQTTDVQPLVAGINAVISAPVVEETTAVVEETTFNATHTVGLPEDVTDFTSLMSWVSSGDDKHIECTANGVKKTGIVFPTGDIKLEEDIVFTSLNTTGVGNTLVLNVVGETTLDLNGHSIKQKGSGFSLALFAVRPGATLNIIDSSENQDGGIYSSYSAFQIDTGATVNLFSGTVDIVEEELRSSADIEYGSCTVFMYGGTFNMYGGTLGCDENAEDWNIAIGGNANYPYATSSCYFYAGTIDGLVLAAEYNSNSEFVSTIPTCINYGATIKGSIITSEEE